LRQGDVKPLAKRLIDQFGSLAAVFSAEISALENAGLGETTIATLKATQAAALHLSRAQLLEEPILSSWQALLDYCRFSETVSLLRATPGGPSRILGCFFMRRVR